MLAPGDGCSQLLRPGALPEARVGGVQRKRRVAEDGREASIVQLRLQDTPTVWHLDGLQRSVWKEATGTRHTSPGWQMIMQKLRAYCDHGRDARQGSLLSHL